MVTEYLPKGALRTTLLAKKDKVTVVDLLTMYFDTVISSDKTGLLVQPKDLPIWNPKISSTET